MGSNSKLKRVAIFDSGTGGLTVLRELLNNYPDHYYIYLGDTARLPYGAKSSSTILKYTEQNINFLEQKETDLLVVACNSASTVLGEIKKRNFPICGVIDPGVQAALDSKPKTNRFVIWGTRATIESGHYKTKIQQQKPEARIHSVACPLLVPLVEEGLFTGNITGTICDLYINQSDFYEGDTLILGCTHYPALRSFLESKLPYINIVDSASAVAQSLKTQLDPIGKNSNKTVSINTANLEMYLTDMSNHTVKTAQKLMNRSNLNIQIADL